MSEEIKAPAFQFYPRDFMTDMEVAVMTPTERGLYITLLCYDWLGDGFDEQHIVRLSGASPQEAELYLNGSSSLVRAKFTNHPNKPSWITNPRIQKERFNQAEWRSKCKKAGEKSGKVRKALAISRASKLKGSSSLVRTKPELNGNSASASASASTININTHTPKPEKFQYGINKTVHLTDLERDEVISKFGFEFFERCVAKLDAWIESDISPKRIRNGKNAAATFRSWVFNAVSEELARASKTQPKKSQQEKNLEMLFGKDAPC